MFFQVIEIFEKIDKGSNLMSPVSKRYKWRVGVHKCIDGIVDAIAEIVLKYIDFHVLKKMKFVFAFYDTLHYHCIIQPL